MKILNTTPMCNMKELASPPRSKHAPVFREPFYSNPLLCFLCRSWLPFFLQNYEDEDLPGPKLQDEMNDYLAEVIEDKGIKDLRDTREQVGGVRCN